MDRFHLQFILYISLSVCLFQRIASLKVGVPLTVELGGCIANVLSQDVKSYAAIDKTCVCEASVKDYGVVVEWIDNDTGVSLQHAIGTAKLKLTPQHIGSNITCRARHNGVKGIPIQLPPIIYGPNKVKIGMDSSDKLYMNKDCLTHIHFTCEFEKSVFPSATLKALITISSADWTSEDTAKSIAELESDDTKTLYYKYTVMIKGNVTIQCVATNSVLERFQSVASTSVQIYEPSEDVQMKVISRKQAASKDGPARRRSKRSIGVLYGNVNDTTNDAPRAVIDTCIRSVGSGKYVDSSKTCLCRALPHPNLTLEVTAEWVHGMGGTRLSHGTDTAPLPITRGVIDDNKSIYCRAKTKEVTGPSVLLPKIIHGPRNVKLIVKNKIDKVFHTLEKCPQTLRYHCTLPKKDIFPKATLSSYTSISRHYQRKSSSGILEYTNSVIEQNISPISHFNEMGGKFISYVFILPITSEGTLTVACNARNSFLEDIRATDKQTIEVTESSMKPSIVSRPGEPLATGNIIVLPARQNGAVSIVCTAPWGNDSQLNLRLRCGGSEKALKDTNVITLLMDQADMMNDTTCTCKMLLNDCNKSGESVKRILFYVPHVGGGGGGGEETTTIIPSNATAAHHGDEENSSGMYIGIGVGLTLCVVLAAIICFYIGYKAGSKKTMKKMLRNNVNIGKVSFTPNSAVTIQPTPAYEYMPEREPLAEAYTDNVHARPKAAADDQYSHIDYAYQSDEKDGPYEQPQTKGGKNKKKKKIQLPPRSAHKQNGQQRSDEHFYDQANVYDRSLDQGTNSVYYEAYSKPT